MTKRKTNKRRRKQAQNAGQAVGISLMSIIGGFALLMGILFLVAMGGG